MLKDLFRIKNLLIFSFTALLCSITFLGIQKLSPQSRNFQELQAQSIQNKTKLKEQTNNNLQVLGDLTQENQPKLKEDNGSLPLQGQAGNQELKPITTNQILKLLTKNKLQGKQIDKDAIDSDEIKNKSIESKDIKSGEINSRTIEDYSIQSKDLRQNQSLSKLELDKLLVGIGSPSHFTMGEGDVYIQDNLEVDGNVYFDQTLYVRDSSSITTMTSNTLQTETANISNILSNSHLHIKGRLPNVDYLKIDDFVKVFFNPFYGTIIGLDYDHIPTYQHIDGEGDLYVHDDLEVNGTIYGTISGAYSPTGDLDMNNHTIENIGSSNTDFTNTGGLNLGDNLAITGNITITGIVDGKDIDLNAGMLNESETITANWVNTANPWADNEIANSLTISGGTIGSNNISGTLTTTGALTIGDGGDTISINSSDWDISTTGVITNASMTSTQLTDGGTIGFDWVDSEIANTLTITGGSIDSTTTIDKNPIITLGTDLSGSVTLSNLASGTLNATIASNSVALGTDTTGNYTSTITGGSGIASTGATTGEGIAHTLSLSTLTSNWDAGGYEIRSNTFESDVATGIAPFIIVSTTKVSNLNSDLLDGYDSSYFATSASSGNYLLLAGGIMTGPINMGNQNITNINWAGSDNGSGSGLDADLWDGNQFASYLNQAVLTTSAPIFTTINTGNGNMEINSISAYLGDQNLRTIDSPTLAELTLTTDLNFSAQSYLRASNFFGDWSFNSGILTNATWNGEAITNDYINSITSSKISDTLPINKGGTGATTANLSLNNLLPTQTGNTNKFLKTDGTNTSWQSILLSDLQDPTSDTQLNINNHLIGFSFTSTDTNSDSLFSIRDLDANLGDGYLLDITTGNSSFLNPFRVSASEGIFPAITVNDNGQVGIGTEDQNNNLTVLGDFDIDGKIGIGTTTPTSPLHILSTLDPQLKIAYDLSNYLELEIDSNGDAFFGITGGTYTFDEKIVSESLETGDITSTGEISAETIQATNLTTYREGDGRVGDAYCKKKEVSDAGLVGDWTNINNDQTCGLNKLCDSGSCIETDFVCGTSQVADADENAYNTVRIGDQCWMASNLNVGTKITSCTGGYIGVCTDGGDTLQNQTDNTTIEKYCYGDNDSNCDTYGGFYQWNEMMQYSTTGGAQGICPTDWHIPTDAEQNTLDQYLTDEGNTCVADRNGVWDCDSAGTKLKVGGSSGFEALLAGRRNPNGSFDTLSSYAYFWSSSESGSYAWRRYLYSSNSTVYRTANNKSDGFSVRCLKD